MSNEFLERCRVLTDKQHGIDVVKTVHGSPAYIKLLDHAERLQQELDVSNAIVKSRGETIRNGLEAYQELRKDIKKVCSDLDISEAKVQRLEATVAMFKDETCDHAPVINSESMLCRRCGIKLKWEDDCYVSDVQQ